MRLKAGFNGMFAAECGGLVLCRFHDEAFLASARKCQTLRSVSAKREIALYW
jgi:hypothetical protein